MVKFLSESPHEIFSSFLLLPSFLSVQFLLLFDHEDGGIIFLRNASGLLPGLHGVTCQKKLLFFVTVVRTSNLLP
jgi:hypothetical protein